MTFLYILGSFVILCSIWHLVRRPRLPPGAKWPPGPTGLPLIGRVWDIPRLHAYKRFKQWSDVYGPLYSINIFGVNHIWLASESIAQDLLSKRAAKHSDRPSIYNLKDSRGSPEYLPLLGNNEIWKRQRKIVAQFLFQAAKSNYHNLFHRELGKFLSELLDRPEDYPDIMESYTSRVISQLSYGVPARHDEVRMGSRSLLTAISPVGYITNIIPQLKYIPEIISPWKWIENGRHAKERVFLMEMHDMVDGHLKAGTSGTSFMRHVKENQEKYGIDDLECAYIVGMIGFAGVLTTATVLMTYVLAMTLHPEWQAKLQDEVDRVCGDRPPELSDSPNLPLLRAVISELMRWRPIIPNSIPHMTTEDDVYEGYFIPKGTYIHPNQWAITREISVFPDPEQFNPDRWLNPQYPTYLEPLTKYPNIQKFSSFGYGRRVCMGIDLAEKEFFLTIGAMAWAAKISKKRDENGREVPVPLHDYDSLFISWPKWFPFDLRARREGTRAKVEELWASTLKEGKPSAEQTEEKVGAMG